MAGATTTGEAPVCVPAVLPVLRDDISTVHYCWLCDKPVSPAAYRDRHYETERPVFFCSLAHWAEYRTLASL
jgi:hypothetical protein